MPRPALAGLDPMPDAIRPSRARQMRGVLQRPDRRYQRIVAGGRRHTGKRCVRIDALSVLCIIRLMI